MVEQRQPPQPHEPGDPHRYELTCTVCGQPGQITVAVEPQREDDPSVSHEPAVVEGS